MAQGPPEVLGWELEEAKARLLSCGWQVEIKVTSPPWKKPEGRVRVIRQKSRPGSVELVVAAHPHVSPATKSEEPA